MAPKLRVLLSVVLVALPVDQLSKILVESRLAHGERVPIVGRDRFDGLLGPCSACYGFSSPKLFGALFVVCRSARMPVEDWGFSR